MSDDEIMALINDVLKPLGTSLRHYMPVHKAEAIAAMRKVLSDDRAHNLPTIAHRGEINSKRA